MEKTRGWEMLWRHPEKWIPFLAQPSRVTLLAHQQRKIDLKRLGKK
jgi:hypothetical protein